LFVPMLPEANQALSEIGEYIKEQAR